MDAGFASPGHKMRLVFLPTEVFGILTCMLNSRDLMRLLISGDGQLIRKLGQPGSVTSLDAGEGDFVGKSLIPSFPHLSKLEFTVRFESLTSLVDKNDLGLFGFTQWPKSLTWLDIWANQVDRPTAVRISTLLTPISFNVSQKLPNLRLLGLPIVLMPCLSDWIATWPTTIDSLEISELDPECALPSSLTILSLYYQVYWPSQVNDSMFPNLTELNIMIEDPEEELESKIDWPALPAQLSSLTIDWSHVGIYNVPVFPPMLTYLSLDLKLEPHAIFPLPNTLTELCLFVRPMVDASFLEKLPVGLISLSVEHHYESFIPGAVKLPPNLEKFSAPKIQFDSFAGLQSIPATITKLSVSIHPEVDLKPDWKPNVLKFPSLRSFCCKQMFPSVWLFQCLRHSRHLKEIYLNRAYSWEPNPIHTQFTAPVHVGDEVIIPPSFSHPGLETPQPLLSQHLESLYIPSGLIGDLFVQQLPTSLTSLTLPNSPHITDACIHMSIKHCQSLLSLVIHSGKITGDTFKALPRNLTNLCFPCSSLIYDNQVPDLPRSLTNIHIYAAIYLTDACGPHLPPKLEQLQITKNELITGALAYFLVPNRRMLLKVNEMTASRNDKCQLLVNNWSRFLKS